MKNRRAYYLSTCLVILFALVVVGCLQGCTGDASPTASSQETATQAQTQETERKVADAVQPAVAQKTLLENPAGVQQTANVLDPDDKRVIKTFATIGLYHLLLTIDKNFELGTTIAVEKFEQLLEKHLVDLGYLLRSSFNLAAELRECMDDGALTRQEVIFMISGAVEGELTEEYPAILPDVGQLIGTPQVITPVEIADAFSESFLREISLEGGVCRELAGIVDIECALFKAFPDL